MEDVEITSAPNPVGSDARALGMGGAFIAVADDATAASWNPGGLIQLEKPEISFVLNGNYKKGKNTFADFSDASGSEDYNRHALNYLSAAWPFAWGGRNMILSLNYQHMYDFKRDFSFEAFIEDSGPGPDLELPLAFSNILWNSSFPVLRIRLTGIENINSWTKNFSRNGSPPADTDIKT